MNKEITCLYICERPVLIQGSGLGLAGRIAEARVLDSGADECRPIIRSSCSR